MTDIRLHLLSASTLLLLTIHGHINCSISGTTDARHSHISSVQGQSFRLFLTFVGLFLAVPFLVFSSKFIFIPMFSLLLIISYQTPLIFFFFFWLKNIYLIIKNLQKTSKMNYHYIVNIININLKLEKKNTIPNSITNLTSFRGTCISKLIKRSEQNWPVSSNKGKRTFFNRDDPWKITAVKGNEVP